MNERACEAVGIDLGTTYSSLAYMDSQKMPRVVTDSSGQTVMPSVVFFDDEEIIVGDMALQQAKVSTERVAQFVKVHMGDQWRKEFLGRVHTPESISAIILGQLIKEAEPQIGSIRRAVITVPAYFTEKRRRATQQAGEIAGLEVIGTLNEPMAATLAYGLHHTEQEKIVVAYDLGGGTFDVTVVRITPNELEELATSGNRQLGGRDWDQALIDYVATDFQEHQGFNLLDEPQAVQDLVLECERAKRRLGRMNRTTIRVHARGHDHQMEITRATFDSLTSHLLHTTRLTTETAVRDAGLTWDRVANVVLVGGSTHMPSIRQMLKDLSGSPPETGVNPVVAVALGAAIYAHMLETGHKMKTVHQKPTLEPADETVAQPRSVPPRRGKNVEPETVPAGLAEPLSEPSMPTVSFVTAHGVGLKIRSSGNWANRVLIPKNTKVPISTTKRFHTQASSGRGSQIRIDITQGDTTDLSLAEHLGTGKITGIPEGEPDGQPVDVTMEFDHQGRLHVHALYVPCDYKMDISLEIPGGLRQEEVDDHRRYLEETGFLEPISAAEMVQTLEEIEEIADEDEDDLPLLEPID